MIDMAALLAGLAAHRPVFHSEADFQHALAWAIHEVWPHLHVRLERQVPAVDGAMYADICAFDGSREVWLELKYKTRGLSANVGGESFSLKDQSAQDLGRYDFLHDVERLERIVRKRAPTAMLGFAVLLTNDSAYWKAPGKRQTIDADFRVHDGRRLGGELAWAPHTGQGTKKDREEKIRLRGIYRLKWRDYSAVGEYAPGRARYTAFRYLSVTVDAGN